MPGKTGREMRMAFSKFGTGSYNVAASVTKGCYFESDGGLVFRPGQVVDNAFNQAFVGAADPGLVDAAPLTLVGRDRYEDFTYIWEALAMGSPAAVTIATSAAGQVTSWRHQCDLAPSIDGLGLTYAIDKGLFVEEATCVKVHGFEETQAENGAMNMTFRGLANTAKHDSTVNTNSTVAGATYPALGNRIVQHQGVFRMNLASGNTLAATDAIEAESVRFSFNRPQDAPHVYGRQTIAEPGDNGWPEPMIEITYARMNTPSANSIRAFLGSSTGLKADWIFTGPLINSTDAYSKIYQFPYLQLMQDGWTAAPSGPTQVKPQVRLAARLAPTSPSGMPFVNPLRLIRIMVNSVNAFA